MIDNGNIFTNNAPLRVQVNHNLREHTVSGIDMLKYRVAGIKKTHRN